MATTQTAPEDQNVTEEHEKDVVITAYAGDDYEDRRAFIDDVLGQQYDIDVLETEETENHNVKLSINLEGECSYGTKQVEETIRPFGSSKKEALVDALDGEELPEWMELEETRKVKEEHVEMLSAPLDAFVEEHTERDALDDLGYESSGTIYARQWSKEVDDTSVDTEEGATINHDVRVEARSSGIKERQVLVHQNDRSKTNQYESEEKVLSFEIKVHVEAGSSDGLDSVSDTIIPDLYQELFGIDGISAVRLTSCEQNVSRTGECYNF